MTHKFLIVAKCAAYCDCAHGAADRHSQSAHWTGNRSEPVGP